MDNYMNYQTMLTEVNTNLVTLRKACDRMEMPEHSKALREIQERVQNHTFRVGIMGEFKRGKSTVINALLGKEIVPADILPCSATLNRIVWDSRPHAVINFKKETGRSSKDVPVEQLSDYVTKLSSESEKMAEEVEDAVVYYPCNFCKNGVEIVDTPGLNDDERMNHVSESVIPTLDAIIMVLVPGSPFSMSEAAFVRNKLMTSDLSRLIFVVNKIDTIRAKDRVKVVEGIRNKINETILEKSASMYGADSPEYKDTKSKLAGIRIFPISAADALDAKLDGDEETFQNSGMAAFEEALSKLLTEERGMLELVSPVGVILSKAKEVQSAIEMRTNAMAMDKEKFEKIQQEAMNRIEAQRKEKKAKVREIKGVAASTYQDLMPMVAAAYNNLEQSLTAYVEQYPISASDFAGETKEQAEQAANVFSETVSTRINEQIGAVLQENTEKMQVEITRRMNNEIEGLEIYNKQLTMELENIQCLIPKTDVSFNNSALDYAAMGLEVVTNFTNIVPGLGSAITGFRDHGVLGGVVGLGAGYVATQAGILGSAVLLTATGLATSVALPLVLVGGGLIGAVGGKKITNAIFKMFGKGTEKKATGAPSTLRENDLQTIRGNILSSVMNNISQMRAEQVLENWLKDTTDATFGGLSERLDQEAEQALQGMQDTLTKIQVDLANGEAKRTESMRRLKETQDELIAVLTNIKPIKDKLDSAINQSVEA